MLHPASRYGLAYREYNLDGAATVVAIHGLSGTSWDFTQLAAHLVPAV